MIEDNIIPQNNTSINTTNAKRKDNRGNLEMQSIYIQKNAKINSTSSIYLETSALKLLCSINGPIYLTIASKSKNDEANKMNITVNVNLPLYCNNCNLNQNEFNKNSIEIQLEDLFTQNILTERYPRTKLV